MYNGASRPTLFYCSESWVHSKRPREHLRKTDGSSSMTELVILIFRVEFGTSSVRGSLDENILRWLGYVWINESRLPRVKLNSTVEGPSPTGQTKSLVDQLCEGSSQWCAVSLKEGGELHADHKGWRKFVKSS